MEKEIRCPVLDNVDVKKAMEDKQKAIQKELSKINNKTNEENSEKRR